MIEPIYLSIAGYKSIFSEQTVKISPLTILAGANSSGKSSFMQPLLLIKQTVEAPFNPGVFLLNGKNVKITDVRQLISKCNKRNSLKGFSIGLHDILKSDKFFYHLEQKTSKLNSLTISKAEFTRNQKNFSLSEKTKIKELQEQLQDDIGDFELVVTKDKCFLLPLLIPKNILNAFSNNPNEIKDDELKQIISAIFPKLADIFFNNKTRNIVEIAFNNFLEKVASSLIYLPGLRGVPERTYPITAVEEIFIGSFENYVASIISDWVVNKQTKKMYELCVNLKKLGIASYVSVKKINDANVEIHISRLLANKNSKKDLVNLADVGLGVSQILPVVVALLVAKKGQIVYIEQPELHLHPKAQLALAEIIADAAKRDVRVVIETHSSLLILGIQTLVAKNELDRELVALHWFTRDQNTGETTVTQAELDENGAFGDWPEDFDDITLKAEQSYLDAVEAKQYASH
jgi:predicted ATPase